MPYISRGRREFPVVSRYNLGRGRGQRFFSIRSKTRAREDNVRIRGGRRGREEGGGRCVRGGHKKGSREWQESGEKQKRNTLHSINTNG